tara:strand:- start:1536 stop:1649 length:114 start_codon:yes stop_codon:yes gene_type:complete
MKFFILPVRRKAKKDAKKVKGKGKVTTKPVKDKRPKK